VLELILIKPKPRESNFLCKVIPHKKQYSFCSFFLLEAPEWNGFYIASLSDMVRVLFEEKLNSQGLVNSAFSIFI
jgi:hypothetical protein